jgi:ABC-type amino acid transport substrate-binding protein
MRRTALLSLMLLAGAGLVASAAPSGKPVPQAIVAKALDAAPESRMEGDQAIDAAVAAAQIGARSSELEERRVELKLDRVEVAPAGFVQRDVRGTGRLMIGSDEDWIPFEFAALYDTELSSVDHPALTLGGTGSGQAVAADAGLARRLAKEVDRRLGMEFAQQPVQLRLDRVRLLPAGRHYLRLDANGIADFGAEGSTPAGVQALYDPRNGEWLRVSYELGAVANRGVDRVVALR